MVQGEPYNLLKTLVICFWGVFLYGHSTWRRARAYPGLKRDEPLTALHTDARAEVGSVRKKKRVNNEYHVCMMSLVKNVSSRSFVDMTNIYYCNRITVQSFTNKCF